MCVCVSVSVSVFAFDAINTFDWIWQWKYFRSLEVSPAEKHFDHSCICCVVQIISASSSQSYCLRHCWITQKLVVYEFYLFMFMCVFFFPCETLRWRRHPKVTVSDLSPRWCCRVETQPPLSHTPTLLSAWILEEINNWKVNWHTAPCKCVCDFGYVCRFMSLTWRDQALGVEEELSISWCNYIRLNNKKEIKGIFGEVDGLCLSERERKRQAGTQGEFSLSDIDSMWFYQLIV